MMSKSNELFMKSWTEQDEIDFNERCEELNNDPGYLEWLDSLNQQAEPGDGEPLEKEANHANSRRHLPF